MRRRAFLMSASLWTVGMGAVWCLTPVAPWDWRPPADETICGFLSDSRTLVTTHISAGSGIILGPIRLWDIKTGNVRASYFRDELVSAPVTVAEGGDLLKLQQHVKGDHFRLRLVDAWTGREVTALDCLSPARLRVGGQIWWILTRDGRITAFDTYDIGGPLIEWHDVASGRLLRRLRGCRGPMCFSPDGRRFAASRDGSIVVFDVLDGNEIAQLSIRQMSNAWPDAFTPDGTLLLDGNHDVWDVAAGSRRFIVPGTWCVFSPDRRYVVSLTRTMKGSWLAYYDITTGQEDSERRLPLLADPVNVQAATDGDRLAITLGTTSTGAQPNCSMGFASAVVESLVAAQVIERRLHRDRSGDE